MKKAVFITLAAAAALMIAAPAAASAATGDIVGTLYTTDILTEVDGKPINSYSLDGETLIALEDLRDYGFEVYYNDNVRSVFITRTGTPDHSFSPKVERGKVGSTAGYYYESDIRAFINGKEIEAYSLNGKMAAKVELIGTEYFDGPHPFYCGYSYDDSKRLLSLYTDPSKYSSFDDTLNDMFGTITGLLDRKTYMHTDDFWFVNRFTGGLMGGNSMKNYHAVYNNGLMVDLSSIFRLYYINPGDFALSPDGETLYLSNTDIEGNVLDYKQVDLSNLHVFPAEKSDFDDAATAVSDTGYKYTLNGVEIPVYTIGCVDYLRLADFDKCGFICCSYDDLMTLTYSPDAEKKSGIEKIDISDAPEECDYNKAIYLNGTNCMYDHIVEINGDLFIKAEKLADPAIYKALWSDQYIDYPNNYKYRMLANYSAENKTAELYYDTPVENELDKYIEYITERDKPDSIDHYNGFTIFKRKYDLDNGEYDYTITAYSDTGIIIPISSIAKQYMRNDDAPYIHNIDCKVNNDSTVTVTFSNGNSCTIDIFSLKITE